jgi:hypothetical protein
MKTGVKREASAFEEAARGAASAQSTVLISLNVF